LSQINIKKEVDFILEQPIQKQEEILFELYRNINKLEKENAKLIIKNKKFKNELS